MRLMGCFLGRHILDHDAAALLGRSPGGVGIWDAEVGVTTADMAIAETGSLLLSTGPGRPRFAQFDAADTCGSHSEGSDCCDAWRRGLLG